MYLNNIKVLQMERKGTFWEEIPTSLFTLIYFDAEILMHCFLILLAEDKTSLSACAVDKHRYGCTPSDISPLPIPCCAPEISFASHHL